MCLFHLAGSWHPASYYASLSTVLPARYSPATRWSTADWARKPSSALWLFGCGPPAIASATRLSLLRGRSLWSRWQSPERTSASSGQLSERENRSHCQLSRLKAENTISRVTYPKICLKTEFKMNRKILARLLVSRCHLAYPKFPNWYSVAVAVVAHYYS